MHKIFNVFFVTLITISLFNCKSMATTAEIESLKDIVVNKNFTFTANSANPVAFANVRGINNLLPPGSNQANISLVNIQNFFEVKNDSIKMDLPFYGEQQIVNGYSEDNGLKYYGTVVNVKSAFNDRKNSYTIRYKLYNKNEGLQLLLTLFTSKKATLTVNSSNRSTISYDGFWKEN